MKCKDCKGDDVKKWFWDDIDDTTIQMTLECQNCWTNWISDYNLITGADKKQEEK